MTERFFGTFVAMRHVCFVREAGGSSIIAGHPENFPNVKDGSAVSYLRDTTDPQLPRATDVREVSDVCTDLLN
jgi:hypothetical protein